MPCNFLADENIDAWLISNLRLLGFTVISVSEIMSGANDLSVLNYAALNNLLVLTEDKDFGELVFSYKKSSSGVILLRYHFSKKEEILAALRFLVSTQNEKLYRSFTVLTEKKFRIRTL